MLEQDQTRTIVRQALIWIGRALILIGIMAIGAPIFLKEPLTLLGVPLQHFGILAFIVVTICGYGIMWLEPDETKDSQLEARASRFRWVGIAVGISSSFWLLLVDQVFGGLAKANPWFAYMPAVVLLAAGSALVMYPVFVALRRSRKRE